MISALAQISDSTLPSRTGADVADWADSPEKLALVWVVGGLLLVGVIALLVKLKMDKD